MSSKIFPRQKAQTKIGLLALAPPSHIHYNISMRKRITGILFAFLLTGGMTMHAFAQRDNLPQKIVRHVHQIQQSAVTANPGALEQNKTISFTMHGGKLERHFVTEHGRPAENDTLDHLTSTLSMSCKAYALDEHWLILAGTCTKAMQAILATRWHNSYYGDSEAFSIQISEYFSDRTIGMMTENGLINDVKTHMAYNDRLLLIWNDEAEHRAPFVNVLATASPYYLQFLQDHKHTLKIHTARFGSNRPFRRKIRPGTICENHFQLDEDWTDLSGTYTDPLFVINPAGNEFLTAFNNAVQFFNVTSDTWYGLTYVDLLFIKVTVQKYRPQDWARIKTRLFYNDTETPYFE